MYSLGMNVGSSSVKAVLLEEKTIIWEKVIAHEGDFFSALNQVFSERTFPEGTLCLATGTEGRYLLNVNNVLESLCIEQAISALNINADAVVSLGGEHFVVYTIDSDGKIITNFSGNKCASGTGEFFKQQLGRMDMKLTDIDSIDPDSKVHALSSRCSVFMKSDCTHKLNKGEATKSDIVLSLSNVMASKVIDFLKRAHITKGRVLLAGGVTKNKNIVAFLKENLPDIDFVVPKEAPYFEAYGAALLASSAGTAIPPADKLYRKTNAGFSTLPELKSAEDRVAYLPPRRGKLKAGGEYILGVDGGSTTTKVALIDIETDEIVASHYGRTHGDPVRAFKNCLVSIKKQIEEQIGGAEINISIAATTGSSREILGVFLETPAVYNEIIAHAIGATYFKEDIDTIFEIGGQDAKYVYLKNKVPIDYAMNEACSAGTGSFLEESASGDLNITNVEEIGDIAFRAKAPLKFGETCSAFINSDIRKAIQYGASKEDITAGLIASIVSNYLNRVVGNRSIGRNIVLQGGVAKNRAVPAAFAMLLDKNIIIPPDPELLGCFGVGILAKNKFDSGLISKGSFNIEAIINSEIIYEREFKCKSCENWCPVKVLNVNGNKYMFGGRCNKYTNIRKKNSFDESQVFNYIEKRNELMFTECAPVPDTFIKKKDYIVGIPMAFSVYTLWPLYSWFFHELGIEIRQSQTIEHEGIARTEGSYCFPAEIAHGAVQSILNDGLDFIFVPHFRDMPSYEKNIHANFCPITQGLPYYMKKAFLDVASDVFLTPVVSFKYGFETALEGFLAMAGQLGVSEPEIRRAFTIANEKQLLFEQKCREMGQRALDEARAAHRPVMAILGRPYNAFTKDANMGIPLKFTSRGYSVIPFDILPFHESEIFSNMYWYYGQQDMKASSLLKSEDNVFITFITNFSCAPDSFMLHYIKWLMGIKPFLILELDSHSADAGVDTRVEAFLDIIDGYRSVKASAEERYDNGLRFINNGKEPLHVMDINENKRIEIFGNKNVKLLLSSMGRLSTEFLAASVRSIDINAEAIPVPDIHVLQLARNHMSGKECLPSQLVLGEALAFFSSSKYRKDEIYLLFVPTTKGPCRTGQYFVFYENLFRDMRLENVVVITLDSENSYNELGPQFSKYAWYAMTVADLMKDVETSLRTCAVEPVSAIARYDELWQELIGVAEQDATKIVPALASIAKEIAKIPLKRELKDTPKVLIVGEIFVRRDDFSVDELIRILSKRGIIGKVSGVGEWVYYCDFVRHYEMKKHFKLIPLYRRYFSKEFKELINWKIESWWKHKVEKSIKDALAVTKLVPDAPHDMDKMMKNAADHFISLELESEIAISSGAASTALLEDYSGVINIAPFACLIGRVIEGLLTPWARQRRLPVMSVEIDGEILPPNIVNKLEIFMLNVLRFKSDITNAELVENAETDDISLDRKLIMK